MPIKKRTLLVIISLGFVLYAAYLNPVIVACTLSSPQNDGANFKQLLSDSSSRIENAFGKPQSNPTVIFFNNSNEFWPLNLNEYGSTQAIGAKICVIVGPKGQNIDVVAHELMHAEIAHRVGYWRRLTQLPMWFDEGLAMQVDYRPRYDLENDERVKTAEVTNYWSARDFFVQNDDLLTKNYAFAKAEVAKWVAKVGNQSVYTQLERIRDGESFDNIMGSK